MACCEDDYAVRRWIFPNNWWCYVLSFIPLLLCYVSCFISFLCHYLHLESHDDIYTEATENLNRASTAYKTSQNPQPSTALVFNPREFPQGLRGSKNIEMGGRKRTNYLHTKSMRILLRNANLLLNANKMNDAYQLLNCASKPKRNRLESLNRVIQSKSVQENKLTVYTL
jgi:hypothetical protein